MPVKFLSILFLFTPFLAFCQFTGGSNDGFTTSFLTKTIITDDVAFKGGNNDGIATINLTKINITDPLIFRGGNDDGFALSDFSRINITDPFIFKGGNDDGFANQNLPKLNITDVSIFKGGNADGFQTALLIKNNLTDAIAFTGGIGRGETQLQFTHTNCDGVTVLWVGTKNSNWEEPSNWDCNPMPNAASTVIIPSTPPHFPVVNFSYEIKTLILQTNASIIVKPGAILQLNGL